MRTREERMMRLARVLPEWTIDDILAATKAAAKIHRADEMVCNGDVWESDESPGTWYDRADAPRRSPYGRAMATLDRIVARYPGFSWYHQSDPRGAAVYILRPGAVRDGEAVEAVYTRGVPL